VSLKEGYGFIRCTDRDARMFFHYSELLDLEREVRLQQEVEFTVVQVRQCLLSLHFPRCYIFALSIYGHSISTLSSFLLVTGINMFIIHLNPC